MEDKIIISVIIPHSNSVWTLSKLLSSIPSSSQIEVVVVDNSPEPISSADIQTNRDFILLFSDPKRGAGGARNVGIDNAHGEWLIFADADDFFTEDAFNVFSGYYTIVDSEMVYFCASSEYIDTGEKATRGDNYTKLVRDYLSGEKTEMDLRLCFSVPWAKMVKRSLIDREHIRYDEVVASNDMYFSLLCGYYAHGVRAVDKTVYVVTVSRGSLTRRRDKAVTLSRFEVSLRYNAFVKSHSLRNYQKSVMVFITRSFGLGISCIFQVVKLLFKYHQNPFVGWKRWYKTSMALNAINKKEKRYIVKHADENQTWKPRSG